jgi:hypothetical protein
VLQAPATTVLVNGRIARAGRTISTGFSSRRRAVDLESSFLVLG